MSAVEDRLAATLAKHRAQYDDYFFICDCGEKWPALAECLDEEVAAHERHVAAVIASSDDLAVSTAGRSRPRSPRSRAGAAQASVCDLVSKPLRLPCMRQDMALTCYTTEELSDGE